MWGADEKTLAICGLLPKIYGVRISVEDPSMVNVYVGPDGGRSKTPDLSAREHLEQPSTGKHVGVSFSVFNFTIV